MSISIVAYRLRLNLAIRYTSHSGMTSASVLRAASGRQEPDTIYVGGNKNDPPTALPRSTGQSPGRRMSLPDSRPLHT